MHTKRDSWRIHDLSVRDHCSHMQFFFSSSLTFQNTIMYNFRRRPGGPSGELLWFIFDRDIAFTLGQGDKTVMLAVPAQSPALQSKATVMNLKHSEFAVPVCPLCSLEGPEHLNVCCILRQRSTNSKHARGTWKWVRRLAKWLLTHTISKQSSLHPLIPLLLTTLCFCIPVLYPLATTRVLIPVFLDGSWLLILFIYNTDCFHDLLSQNIDLFFLLSQSWNSNNKKLDIFFAFLSTFQSRF